MILMMSSKMGSRIGFLYSEKDLNLAPQDAKLKTRGIPQILILILTVVFIVF
jgi:hypothetical protein